METNDELVERPNTGSQPPNSVGPLNEPVEGHKYFYLGVTEQQIQEAAKAAEGTAPTLQPGAKCAGCGRTVPHPRKESSPTSKTRAYKVPVDELPAHDAVLDAAADHIGAAGKPFWQFKTVTAALACLLQDEGARGLHG